MSFDAKAWRSENKDKLTTYKKIYAENNKERLSNYHKIHRQKKQDLIDSYKDKPCLDCGNKFPLECMDFDHRNSEIKRNCVGTLVSRSASEEAIIAEIAKCDLVCSNCHRIRTKKRREARK